MLVTCAAASIKLTNSPEAPDLRAVTAVLYLNGAWEPPCGGALRIYGGKSGQRAASAAVDVEPRRGTLAPFWSHRVPHEVLPAQAPRFALSLWMCVDAQRQPDGWLGGRFALE